MRHRLDQFENGGSVEQRRRHEQMLAANMLAGSAAGSEYRVVTRADMLVRGRILHHHAEPLLRVQNHPASIYLLRLCQNVTRDSSVESLEVKKAMV